jgi:hypothetical protein
VVVDPLVIVAPACTEPGADRADEPLAADDDRTMIPSAGTPEVKSASEQRAAEGDGVEYDAHPYGGPAGRAAGKI